MWAVMTAFTPAATAARNGLRCSVNCSGPKSIRGSPRWESPAVSPWPGKCLAQAATPADCRPRTYAAVCRATMSPSLPKERTPMTGLSGLELTSASGA